MIKNDFDVVLVGTDANAYYMSRNFYEEYKIKPHVVGRVSMMYTSDSNITDVTIVKDLIDNDVFVKTLVEMAKSINKKNIILVGCNDDYVSLIIKNRKILSKYYLFNYTNFDLFSKLVNKEEFYSNFKDSILDFPKTYFYDVASCDNFDMISDFDYPLIIKASNIIEYHLHEFEGQAKVYKLYNLDEVKSTVESIRNSGYRDKLIIQEFIPGDDTKLFDCVFYVSSRGNVELQSFAQIGLQEHTKTGIGNLTVVINGYNEFNNTDIIKDKLKLFLEIIKFNGICEFDLKYDVRDGKFKVFEINARQARSSYYLTKCGYNLAKCLVDDLILGIDKEFKFIDEEACLSFVPDYVISKYINNIEYKKKFFQLKKRGLYVNPLKCKLDRKLSRKVMLFLKDVNYIKKYKDNIW